MVSLFISVLLLLSPAQRDSILAEHPVNASFWEEIYQEYSGDTLTHIDHLFLNMPDSDRDSMTLPILTDHLFSAMSSRSLWYAAMPDSVFLEYLLQYRITDEPLSSYRSALEAWLERRLQLQPTPFATAEAIQNVVTNNIGLTAATQGPVLSPTQIIPVGQASREGRWVLLCACMRSMGIPVKPVKGWFPGADRNLYRWMEVWTDSGWQTLTRGMPPIQYVKVAIEYPSLRNVTANYRSTGTLTTEPLADTLDGWEVELMIPSGDDTVAVTGVQIDPFQRTSVELGVGEFLLSVRFVQEGEIVGSSIQTVNIDEGATLTVFLTEAQYEIVPLP
jgi:hypothetical protein